MLNVVLERHVHARRVVVTGFTPDRGLSHARTRNRNQLHVNFRLKVAVREILGVPLSKILMQVTVAHFSPLIQQKRLDDGVAFQLLTDALFSIGQHPVTRWRTQIARSLNLAGSKVSHVQTAVDVCVTVCCDAFVTHPFTVHNLVRPLGAFTQAGDTRRATSRLVGRRHIAGTRGRSFRNVFRWVWARRVLSNHIFYETIRLVAEFQVSLSLGFPLVPASRQPPIPRGRSSFPATFRSGLQAARGVRLGQVCRIFGERRYRSQGSHRQRPRSNNRQKFISDGSHFYLLASKTGKTTEPLYS